ncbi:MAG: hypothetical protein HYR66_04380 [Sphingobacteriales bacterium]|nr:hypothetical protein [Sphingobacteriales bacterium]MBI3720238.1 hypothetical protein [Sphingobacteriales bacterium]
MKLFTLTILIFLTCTTSFSQIFQINCKAIKGKSGPQNFERGKDSLHIKLEGKDTVEINKLLKNSKLGGENLYDIGNVFAKAKNKNFSVDSIIKIRKPSDSAEVTLLLTSKIPDDTSIKSVKLIFSCDGKKGDTTILNLVAEKMDDEKRDNHITNWPASKLCSAIPSYAFINKDMFDESIDDFALKSQNCYVSKYKRKLPGEYILLYDFRKGDYSPLKKIARKASKIKPKNPCVGEDGKTPIENARVEFYRLKKSPFFSPSVGSQVKIELMNYLDTVPLNLDVTYRDNFLEEESRFSSLLNTFGVNEAKAGKKQDTTSEKEPKTEQESAKSITDEQKNRLIQLNQELCYYLNHFKYNSFTASFHEENLKTIEANIRSAFHIGDSISINDGLSEIFGNDETGKMYLKSVQNRFDRISGLQSILFTAFKVKDRDNIIIRFKDNKNQVRKEEELRISNGFKVDFSSGIFLTGLKDETYIFKDTSVSYTPSGGDPRDTSGKYIIRENTSPRKLGFGILVHGYPRLSSNYNLGITTGLSINTNTEVNLMAGLSLMLGSVRRIVFSGGFIWGKANRLSNSVKEGFFRKENTNTSAPVFYSTPNNEVPVVSDWYRSWFIGLSYNFTSNR